MGGIEESAIDQLSLVTQLTKHIRVKASGGRASVSELGQFSPIFVWLLRVLNSELFSFYAMDIFVFDGINSLHINIS